MSQVQFIPAGSFYVKQGLEGQLQSIYASNPKEIESIPAGAYVTGVKKGQVIYTMNQPSNVNVEQHSSPIPEVIKTNQKVTHLTAVEAPTETPIPQATGPTPATSQPSQWTYISQLPNVPVQERNEVLQTESTTLRNASQVLQTINVLNTQNEAYKQDLIQSFNEVQYLPVAQTEEEARTKGYTEYITPEQKQDFLSEIGTGYEQYKANKEIITQTIIQQQASVAAANRMGLSPHLGLLYDLTAAEQQVPATQQVSGYKIVTEGGQQVFQLIMEEKSSATPSPVGYQIGEVSDNPELAAAQERQLQLESVGAVKTFTGTRTQEIGIEQYAARQEANLSSLSELNQAAFNEWQQARVSEPVKNLGLGLGAAIAVPVLGVTGAITAVSLGLGLTQGVKAVSQIVQGESPTLLTIQEAYEGATTGLIFGGASKAALAGLQSAGAIRGITKVTEEGVKVTPIGSVSTDVGIGAAGGYILSGGNPEAAAEGALFAVAIGGAGRLISGLANKVLGRKAVTIKDVRSETYTESRIGEVKQVEVTEYKIGTERVNAATVKQIEGSRARTLELNGTGKETTVRIGSDGVPEMVTTEGRVNLGVKGSKRGKPFKSLDEQMIENQLKLADNIKGGEASLKLFPSSKGQAPEIRVVGGKLNKELSIGELTPKQTGRLRTRVLESDAGYQKTSRRSAEPLFEITETGRTSQQKIRRSTLELPGTGDKVGLTQVETLTGIKKGGKIVTVRRSVIRATDNIFPSETRLESSRFNKIEMYGKAVDDSRTNTLFEKVTKPPEKPGGIEPKSSAMKKGTNEYFRALAEEKNVIDDAANKPKIDQAARLESLNKRFPAQPKNVKGTYLYVEKAPAPRVISGVPAASQITSVYEEEALSYGQGKVPGGLKQPPSLPMQEPKTTRKPVPNIIGFEVQKTIPSTGTGTTFNYPNLPPNRTTYLDNPPTDITIDDIIPPVPDNRPLPPGPKPIEIIDVIQDTPNPPPPIEEPPFPIQDVPTITLPETTIIPIQDTSQKYKPTLPKLIYPQGGQTKMSGAGSALFGKKRGFYLKGLTEYPVMTAEEILGFNSGGKKKRK